jgi:hypothetical protein
MSVKGEKYTSKKSKMKHEKTESMAMRMKEYGKKATKKVAKKKSMNRKKGM